MKTTLFYTVPFLALLLADYSVAMSKFTSSVNSYSIDQWFSKWSISTPRGQLDHPRSRQIVTASKGVTEWPGGQ